MSKLILILIMTLTTIFFESDNKKNNTSNKKYSTITNPLPITKQDLGKDHKTSNFSIAIINQKKH